MAPLQCGTDLAKSLVVTVEAGPDRDNALEATSGHPRHELVDALQLLDTFEAYTKI